MIALQDKKVQMDDLLDKMARELQLDKTRYERMIAHYEAVKDWIEADEGFFRPYRYDVYPHGSVRIRTTVKPIGKDEFDLDIAVQLKANMADHSPGRIYNELRRRLEENEAYKKKLEAKNRCLRLNYSGDFHMDILPGVQAYDWDTNTLKVPDKKLQDWVISNPRGYSKWFIGKSNLVKESLLEKALRAEKLPVDDFRSKKPLQRAVQLIKRYRDIFFQADDTYRTSSIVLTTISGQFYEGEESIFDTVDNIVTQINEKVGLSQGRFKILNPVNPAEDFTDKWEQEPKYYDAFENFCRHLYNQWQDLKKENGVVNEGLILGGLFGRELLQNAQTSQAQNIEGIRERKALGINRTNGILGGVSGTGNELPVKPNTFFGK